MALDESRSPFEFSDCSLGNLVFAGTYLLCGGRFNDAVDDYCALLGLPSGVVENVTTGENAFLVALDANDRLLGSEEEIVDAKGRNSIKDIFLIREPLTASNKSSIRSRSRNAYSSGVPHAPRSCNMKPMTQL